MWVSYISRSEITFQVVILRCWGSQQGSPVVILPSVIHVLPFCIFPYIQNSIYTSFSKNGFECLIFPSNKAGALMNTQSFPWDIIFYEYLVDNELWSSQAPVEKSTDLEGTDRWFLKVTRLECAMSLSKCSPKSWAKLESHSEVPKRALRGYFRWNLGTEMSKPQ